jgi:hypothetical protein
MAVTASIPPSGRYNQTLILEQIGPELPVDNMHESMGFLKLAPAGVPIVTQALTSNFIGAVQRKSKR